MDFEERNELVRHNPKPERLTFTVPKRFVYTLEKGVIRDIANGLIIRLNSGGYVVKDAKTDGQSNTDA